MLQILLISGVPLGRYAWGGKHRLLPASRRPAAGLAVMLYVVFAGLLPGGSTLPVFVGSWVLVGYFALSILPNAISPSTRERIVQTPVSILLALGALAIALTPR